MNDLTTLCFSQDIEYTEQDDQEIDRELYSIS